MDPQTLARLSKAPEFQELRTFLEAELRKLHSIADLADVPRAEREQALEGRLWAFDALSKILGGIVPGSVVNTGVDPKEYVVE